MVLQCCITIQPHTEWYKSIPYHAHSSVGQEFGYGVEEWFSPAPEWRGHILGDLNGRDGQGYVSKASVMVDG